VPLTVTCTVQPSLGWSIKCQAAGGTGAHTWKKYIGGSFAYSATVGTGNPITDYLAPLNIPISYVATDSLGEVGEETVIITVNPAMHVLADRFDPTTAVAVKIDADTLDNQWEARSTFYSILSRRDPIVAMDVPQLRSGSITVLEESRDQRYALQQLLATGHVLTLRGACFQVDSFHLLPLGVSENWADPPTNITFRRRWLDIEYQAVTGDLPINWVPEPLPEDRIFDDVTGEADTFDELETMYATFNNLRDGVPAAVVELEGVVLR
jgi:hypothetical protein